jgi:DMSO/TMAO reductase YedYZ molybdopterin-dependent catalytic subunit
MGDADQFLSHHAELTRRYFLQAGVAVTAITALRPTGEIGVAAEPLSLEQRFNELTNGLESYFTAPDQFRDVSRGTPIPHTLDAAAQQAAGLTRDTWKLEVISDPEHPARIRAPLTISFAELQEIGRQHAVRFPKVMTCLNIGCPLGMGIWEGVPLREIVWRTRPSENLRRLHYYGFHNGDPQQQFRSSLPIGRVLEDPFDLPPVILCYKLNGEWLDIVRGGPVRIVVPEAYGFKSVKWLSHVVLSNLAHANDTYADGNNDIDSPLKTFAATLQVARNAMAGEPIAVSGYAQVGISGLARVQVSIHPANHEWPAGDAHFDSANWRDAVILPPPKSWGGALPGGSIPAETLGFNASNGQPNQWPMRLAKAHWAIVLPGEPQGKYVLRCRTIDEKGVAQPRPRPFRKSGHAAIEQVDIDVA